MQMGYIPMQQLALLLLASATVQLAAFSGHAPVPAPSASPGPAPAPTLNTISATWVIANLNYYDLTKPWTHAEDVEEHSKNVRRLINKPSSKGKSSGASDELGELPPPGEVAESVNEGLSDVAEGKIIPEAEGSPKDVNDVAKDMGNVVDGAVPDLEKVALHVRKLKAKRVMMLNQKSFLQKKVTIQKALRTAIETSVKGTICNPLGAGATVPSPAPAMVMAAPAPVPVGPNLNIPPPINPVLLDAQGGKLRGSGPAPAPMPALSPAPACPQPRAHVAFYPGKPMKIPKLSLLQRKLPPHPKETKVEVTIFDDPNNGVDDLAAAKAALDIALTNGVLIENVRKVVHDVVSKVIPNFVPKISAKSFKVQHKAVEAWDIEGCENHMSMIIRNFTIHYTKRQVPMALYDACTNFMTQISFSHDYVLDHRDVVSCRKATKDFAMRWKLGKNDNPTDFHEMCHDFCEAKFGNDAPKCHITGGDNLANQPL